LTKISESGHIISLDDQGKEEMDFALKTGGQEIKAITRVDENGRILHTLPYDGKAIGKDISYQKHIREIMNKKRPVVSDVFTAVQGYNAVALHVPVFKGNDYRGTLAFLIDFEAISKRFLQDIRIGETGYAWMTSSDGIELYCPIPGHTGKSVFENRKDFPSIISMAKEMVKGNQGVTTYAFDRIRDRKTEIIRKQAVYLPVKVGQTFWTIVVASSEDEALAYLESFRNKLVFVIGLLLLGSAIFSFYGMRARAIIIEAAKRQKIEEELRESEERYRDLVENATDLIFTHDLTGAFLSVNAAFAREIGLGAGEYAGLSVPDIISQDLRHEFKDYIKAIQREGKANGIMKIVTRNGEERLWEYRNTLRTKGVPEPVVRGMVRDVTGEILAKRALRKSEKRYRLLFERNLAGVYRSTPYGRLIDCNDAFARIFGYDSLEEAKEQPVLNFYDSSQARQNFIAALQAGGTLLDFEHRGRRKDGSLIWLLESASLVPGDDFKPAEIEGTLIDITERKRTEEALQESEELLRSYLENAPDGIYMNDLEGNFLYGNRKCEEMTGYRREELIGKNPLELNLLPEKSLNKAVRLFQANIEGRSAAPEEIELIRKQGEIISVEINTSVVQRMGQRVIIGSVRDITERKKIEEELLKADKLESVGILAGGIAHDFNNILTSISGNISLARMHLKPGSKEFDLLSAAETAAIRASGLTRQLLTFAKGGLPVKEIASIQTLIKESSLFVLQGSKVKCEISVAEDLWPVEADTGQISQVISNIVINANQAMPEGG
ncbi:MAG: PAS domain S-box protein, partial [Proteobacteria bacterium]|nr:PAS domain S-box protein [Pseudomonadota bacterium]